MNNTPSTQIPDEMEKVIPYSIGPMTASVCADNSLSLEEVVTEFNKISPSGTMNGWGLSPDTHFLQGQPNPCPCDRYPETRKHYLFNC